MTEKAYCFCLSKYRIYRQQYTANPTSKYKYFDQQRKLVTIHIVHNDNDVRSVDASIPNELASYDEQIVLKWRRRRIEV